MELDFETLYNSYSKEQLSEILLSQQDYQPAAVEAAWKIAKSKGWHGSIKFQLNFQIEEENKDKHDENKMKSILADQCFLEINGYHIMETDAILSESDIDHCFLEKVT